MTREAFSGVFVFVTFCNSCNYNNANTGNCQRHLVNLRNFVAMHKLGRVFLVFYDKYVRLCNSVNKTPSAVAMEIGLQKSTVTRWSKGTKPNYATAQKVADYFGVPVEELIEKKKDKFPSDKVVDILVKASETKKAPTQEGERPIDFDDFTFAMQNEAKDLTDMDKQILLSMAKQLKDARKNKDGESG